MNPATWTWPTLITVTLILWAVFTVIVYYVHRWWTQDPSLALTLMATFLAVGIPFAIVAAYKSDAEYRTWCAAQEPGAHVDTHTESTTVTTVDGKGNVGTGTETSTTYYCLSADGRIIDIS